MTDLYNNFFSDTSFDKIRGIERVSVWEKRYDDCPFAITATSAICTAEITNSFMKFNTGLNIVSVGQLKSQYAVAISRLVAYLDEKSDKNVHGASAAEALSFNPSIIQWRNRAMHSKKIPTLQDLRYGSMCGKYFLKRHYWETTLTDFPDYVVPRNLRRKHVKEALSEYFALQCQLLYSEMSPMERTEKENDVSLVLHTIQSQMLGNRSMFLEILMSNTDFVSFTELEDCLDPVKDIDWASKWIPFMRMVITSNCIQPFLETALRCKDQQNERAKNILTGWCNLIINEVTFLKLFGDSSITERPDLDWIRLVSSCSKDCSFLLPAKLENLVEMSEKNLQYVILSFQIKILKKEEAHNSPQPKRMKTNKSEMNIGTETSTDVWQNDYIVRIANSGLNWASTPFGRTLISKIIR